MRWLVALVVLAAAATAAPAHADATLDGVRVRTTSDTTQAITVNHTRGLRHRGPGIFLHVNGAGATAGWVSAPRWFLRMLTRTLGPDRRPVVAVGR